jgi:hypothetical protein
MKKFQRIEIHTSEDGKLCVPRKNENGISCPHLGKLMIPPFIGQPFSVVCELFQTLCAAGEEGAERSATCIGQERPSLDWENVVTDLVADLGMNPAHPSVGTPNQAREYLLECIRALREHKSVVEVVGQSTEFAMSENKDK